MPAPNDWRLSARCRRGDIDRELFFHPDGERGNARRNRLLRAKQICHQCPVILQCRDYALGIYEGFGIWGGMSEEERTRTYIAAGGRSSRHTIHVEHW
ncbi:WhiB family transcriptional regulator [Mycolicibacterium llatzerense]|uniref:WhiB family transcriptional regulator n=1 Tax=Mycolicibacterium llatzerense TaxID=280871 RepID=UPI0009F54577|nr:WhiB family transcriptional regulator [Mycolicibacterium llatzerense]